MPIQFPDIRRLSFEEANPWLIGAEHGMGMARQGQDLISNLLAQRKAEAELPYAGRLAGATAAYKEAMAKYLSNPYQIQRFMTPLGKAINEQNMMQGSGTGNIGGEGGEEAPASPYQAFIQKTAYDPVQARQAQNAQLIYNQINDIDTKPLEKFAGAGGHLRALKERGKGTLSSLGFPVEPSEDWREYNAYLSVNKNAIMDAIRSALKTSVVPDYVGATLQPMVDPASPIWNDPAQVRKNIATLKAWIKPYAGEQTEAMSRGVAPTLQESEKRHQRLVNEINKSQPSGEEKFAGQEAGKGAKRLAKGLELPSFPSKEAFQEWFKRQPKVVKDAVRLRLGG